MKLECQSGSEEFPYGVSIRDYNFGSSINGISYEEVCMWCYEQFGYEYATNRYRIYLTTWFFKHEADRTFFIMRWS